ncbi:MAG: 50S ribosomal protein L4 [Aquificaceae bacterium]|nr:50S ribosomal protein L4 [Aquificaceae bacterium]
MKTLELEEGVFNEEIRKDVLWQVVRWQLARKHTGNHNAKTRGEVSYSSRKLLPQKGTGNARHGDRGANIFVGGGVVHGPRPRSYEYKLTKKFRRLGVKIALSYHVKHRTFYLIDNLDLGEVPKTQVGLQRLRELGVANSKCLIVSDERNFVLERTFRNIKSVKVLHVDGLNVYDILWAQVLIVLEAAYSILKEKFS